MPTLTDTQYSTLADRARAHIAETYQFVTVTVTRDDPEFQTVVAELPDGLAIALFLDGPHVAHVVQAAPAHAPEPPKPTEEPRDGAQIARWVTEGQDAYRRGVARDDLGEGKRRLAHRQAGWDHAKAEAEAKLAVPSIAELAIRETEPEMAAVYLDSADETEESHLDLHRAAALGHGRV